ncbi:hypothetical protein [Streptomyces shenzhenensis]|nr:hypothetical protein [Streptomyces shenzhenensis]
MPGSRRSYGIDAEGLAGWARELAGRVEGGAGSVDARGEAPRLRGTG